MLYLFQLSKREHDYSYDFCTAILTEKDRWYRRRPNSAEAWYDTLGELKQAFHEPPFYIEVI